MSGCACIYVGDMECCTEEIYCSKPKAYFKHQCGECGGTIKPGERYERFVGYSASEMESYDYLAEGQGFRGDRDIFVGVTCLDCLSVRNEMFCEGFCWGAIWEDVNEHISDVEGQISSECLEALTPGARAMMIDSIDECWAEMDEDEDDDEEADIHADRVPAQVHEPGV